MSDSEVVPITPGTRVEHPRSVAILDHVAAKLAGFLERNGEEPESIVFMIMGEEGTVKVEYLIAKRWRQTCALASCLFASEAAGPDRE